MMWCFCRLVELIEDATDPGIFGQLFYYSYGTDITLTQQRFTALQESGEGHRPQWARADRRFFWNKFLTQPLIGLPLPLPRIKNNEYWAAMTTGKFVLI